MAASYDFAEFPRFVIDQGDVSGSWRKWHMEFTLAMRIKTLIMRMCSETIDDDSSNGSSSATTSDSSSSCGSTVITREVPRFTVYFIYA